MCRDGAVSKCGVPAAASQRALLALALLLSIESSWPFPRDSILPFPSRKVFLQLLLAVRRRLLG